MLGPALGYLGWSELLMGLALMVLVGGIGGAVLGLHAACGRFPYGPFMLVGAAAASSWDRLAAGLGY